MSFCVFFSLSRGMFSFLQNWRCLWVVEMEENARFFKNDDKNNDFSFWYDVGVGVVDGLKTWKRFISRGILWIKSLPPLFLPPEKSESIV